MGVALNLLGKHEEAIIWYDKALEVDPESVYALYNKGAALSDWGRMKEQLSGMIRH